MIPHMLQEYLGDSTMEGKQIVIRCQNTQKSDQSHATGTPFPPLLASICIEK